MLVLSAALDQTTLVAMTTAFCAVENKGKQPAESDVQSISSMQILNETLLVMRSDNSVMLR